MIAIKNGVGDAQHIAWRLLERPSQCKYWTLLAGEQVRCILDDEHGSEHAFDLSNRP